MAKDKKKSPIKELGGNLKKSAWAAIIESLVVIVFGVLLIAWPGIILSIVAKVLGVVLIVIGVYQIINYFMVGGPNDFFDNSLLAGVISILIGIAAIVATVDLANVFRVIVGIWLIYEALVRFNTAIKLHAAGTSVWGYVLLIAIVMLAAGIFVTFNTTAVLLLIGWIMVLSGIFGIVGDFIFISEVDSVEKTLTRGDKKA